MHTQNGFHTSFFVPDVTDYIEYIESSNKPDQNLLNLAIAELEKGELEHRRSKLRVLKQMLDNGYTLETSGSFHDQEMFFIHHSVINNWNNDDLDINILKQLIVKV